MHARLWQPSRRPPQWRRGRPEKGQRAAFGWVTSRLLCVLCPGRRATGLSRQDRGVCGQPPHGAPVRNSVRNRAGPGELLEGASELRARPDVELAEGAAKVSLDCVLGQEEGLRNLAVGHPLGGHASDAELGSGEVAAALNGISAGAGTGSDELVV